MASAFLLFSFWHIFYLLPATMRFTALFLLSASATGAAFVPPTGYGVSVPHGESALAAKRDFLRSIFHRPSRLAAKVSQFSSLFYLCPTAPYNSNESMVHYSSMVLI
jgi:hypothetical protein